MRYQQHAWTVQDAAICSIIDILDGNLEGEYSLSGTDEAADARQGAHVPEGISVVVEAMRIHSSFAALQYRGSHSLGLLNGLLPMGSEVPEAAVEAVMQALWRHPYEFNVVCGVTGALRAFLEPRGGRCQSNDKVTANIGRVVSVLRDQKIGTNLSQILVDYTDTDHESGRELLEDTVYVLALIDGISSVRKVILASPATAESLRAAGLKGIFELGQFFPELLSTPTVAAEIAALIETLTCACSPAGSSEIKRNAEMLHGFLCYLSQTTLNRQLN